MKRIMTEMEGLAAQETRLQDLLVSIKAREAQLRDQGNRSWELEALERGHIQVNDEIGEIVERMLYLETMLTGTKEGIISAMKDITDWSQYLGEGEGGFVPEKDVLELKSHLLDICEWLDSLAAMKVKEVVLD